MKLPRWFWVLSFLVCWPTLLFAQPLYATTSGDVTVTLTDEKCELKTISNLPYKAIWTEKDKTYEGCWAAREDYSAVVAYFADLTVALIPIYAFKKVTQI